MIELFNYSFFVNAIISGTLLAIITAVLSFFIVLKGYSYYSVGISHISFAGVSLGLLLGFNPIITAMIFTIIAAFGIGNITRKRNISEDSAIGIFFSSAMALGIIFISMIENYTVNAMSYLFGDILAISKFDIYIMLFFGVIIIFVIYSLFKYLLMYVFDEEYGKINDIPVGFLHYFLLITMAVVIVLSIKAIGIVLVSALLVIPGNSAYLLSKKYKNMMFLTILISLFSVYAGIFGSYYLDIPSGAAIVVINAIIFGIIYLYKNVIKNQIS